MTDNAVLNTDDMTEATPEVKAALPTIDIAALRQTMLLGSAALMGSLFEQVGYENSRIARNRNVLELVEQQIMTEEFIRKLEPAAQVNFYSLVNRNMNTSLKFLQDLHATVANAMETVKTLEDANPLTPASGIKDIDPVENADIRNEILMAIKKRLESRRQT